MASIEDATYAYLSAQTALTAIVGTRIEPMQFAQQTALPRVLITKTVDVPTLAASGNTGAYRATLQIEAQARDIATAENARNALKTALSGYRGTFGALFATRVAIASESDQTYPPAAGEETVVVAKVLDVDIHYC